MQFHEKMFWFHEFFAWTFQNFLARCGILFFHFLSSQLILCLDILIITLSGSDHRRSQSNPWSGTSVGRIIRLICSIDWRSGLNPPWQQKIFSSTMAATGRQLKQSVKVFHNLMLYRRLPGILKVIFKCWSYHIVSLKYAL